MITSIKINGFKSFQNFEMAFTPLTVVAGPNASGKSNLFDALQLLARLAQTDLKSAFLDLRGNPIELFTQYAENTYASEMSFSVEMLVNRKIKDKWGGEATLKNTRLRYNLIIARNINELGFDDLFVKLESLENIKPKDDLFIKFILPKEAKTFWQNKLGGHTKPFIETMEQNGIKTIKIRQDGKRGGKATPANAVTQTVLGGVNSVDFPHVFAAKEEMQNWKFLQLNPKNLREPTRQNNGLSDIITTDGSNLASALYRIRQTDKYIITEISRTLNSFLPNFTEVNVYDDKVNRQFIIKVKEEDGKEFSSHVLSEGTLRLLALCILAYDDKLTGLICFEEPENGIHPFRISTMLNLLNYLVTDFKDEEAPLRQVIINTHSPVLVSQIVELNSNNASLWFSRLNSLITDINDCRIKIKITKMTPIKKPQQMLFFPVSEPEQKITLSEVIEYLETADTENSIKAIRGRTQ